MIRGLHSAERRAKEQADHEVVWAYQHARREAEAEDRERAETAQWARIAALPPRGPNDSGSALDETIPF